VGVDNYMKINDLVIVIDEGLIYSNYRDMAKIMGLHNFIYGELFNRSDAINKVVYKIVAIHQHHLDDSIILYGIEKDIDPTYQFIIASSGVKSIITLTHYYCFKCGHKLTEDGLIYICNNCNSNFLPYLDKESNDQCFVCINEKDVVI
jgi:NADH pyrophosphatase NudC (nudix superfamily)